MSLFRYCCLSFFVSLSLFVCLSECLSLGLSFFLTVNRSNCLYFSQSSVLLVFLSVCLPLCIIYVNFPLNLSSWSFCYDRILPVWSVFLLLSLSLCLFGLFVFISFFLSLWSFVIISFYLSVCGSPWKDPPPLFSPSFFRFSFCANILVAFLEGRDKQKSWEALKDVHFRRY